MQNQNMKVDMGFVNEKFPVATHMCLIYNSEEERKNVITKYIQSGIINKEKVMYLADNATKSDIASWLMETGIDVQSEDTEKFIDIVDAEEAYCSGGYFSPDKMLEGLKKTQEEILGENYCCLRASGEMTWALKGIPGSEKLIEYESRLNNLVKSHPFLALCQYDATRFDGKTIFNVLKVHPYMIVKGQILKNPYYITPEEFLETCVQ